MQEREHFHKKAIRTNKEIHWSSYKRLRNAVTLKLRKEKRRYYSTRLSEDQNSKIMWKTLNKILPKKPKTAAEIENLSATKFNQYFTTIAGSLCGHFTDPSPQRVLAPRVDQEFIPQNVSSAFVLLELRKLKSTKATGLNGIPAKLLKGAAQEVAKPIANLINLTFSTGEIPQEWKEAKVTPIFKSGEKDDVNNYRPISVLPLISKIMERAIQVQLVSFLTENNVHSEHQSGFRKRHSTQTAVTYLSDFILENMDKQKLTGAVFIDLKKAFDLVNHKCLLYKLEHYGVRGLSHSWFQNYLCTRSQRVKFKELSSSLPLSYGVPQGSILGPLLFVLYINDLPQCLVRSNISMYADDTVIYTTGSRPDDVMMKIQEDIQRVEQWMKSNQLVLNLTKTKSLLFGTAQKLAGATDFNILIQGKEIDRVSNFCYLGVTLDENLSWKEHVGEVFKKVNKRLGLLGRIRSCLTIQAAKCIYNCLILPVLSYTETAWGELSAECSNRLQRLQNRAARITIRYDRSSDAIKNLGWEKLETIRKRNKATLVFKCLNNLAPAYFKNYFTRNSSYHFYNTRQKQDLHIPKAKRSKGKKTFIFSGATLFNRLPDSLKQAKSLQIFKRNIGHYSF